MIKSKKSVVAVNSRTRADDIFELVDSDFYGQIIQKL